MYERDRCPPVNVHGKFYLEKAMEVISERKALIAKAKPNIILTSDPTPQSVRDAFYKIFPCLGSILEKDSVRRFLRFLVNTHGMDWDLTITSQTLTCMISYDALRCAKVVLEGKVLNGVHANPNCINPLGFFPLHEAAEKFSVEMIKLLFRHGASANVRTVGDNVPEGLLPLHVAVENTCLHKYLEDNLIPNQNNRDYIYKIIHLLCLPEMKIFLGTIKLLAQKTDNLVDEIWNYMENGKLLEAAVLLLAAEEQIRGGCSSKLNGNYKRDGFDIIMHRIVRRSVFLRWEVGRNASEQKQQEENRILVDCIGLLTAIVSEAGEKLSALMQVDSEVSHVEVMERVTYILKDYGFCPPGKIIEAKNLCPYDCIEPNKDALRTCNSRQGIINSTMAATETTNLHVAERKTRTMKKYRGWDPTYTRRMFFPYWRSVLLSQCPIRVYPSYSEESKLFMASFYHSNSMANGSTPVPSDNHCLLGRIPQRTRNYPSVRFLGAAGSMILKVLKKA